MINKIKDVAESMFDVGVGVFFFLLIIFAALAPILLSDYFVTKRQCEVWDRQVGRTVRFVSSFPLYWDCLVMTKSGWYPLRQLQQIETPDLK